MWLGVLSVNFKKKLKHKENLGCMLNLYSTRMFCLQFSSEDQVCVMLKVQISLSEKVLQRKECGWTRRLLIE